MAMVQIKQIPIPTKYLVGPDADTSIRPMEKVYKLNRIIRFTQEAVVARLRKRRKFRVETDRHLARGRARGRKVTRARMGFVNFVLGFGDGGNFLMM